MFLTGDDISNTSSRKTFPTRTEGSVKKHWYKVRSLPMSPECTLYSRTQALNSVKDMHYADFAEDEVIATSKRDCGIIDRLN